jgi:hypothetical protein
MGVPEWPDLRHAPNETQPLARPPKARAGLVGSERVRRHPHRHD